MPLTSSNSLHLFTFHLSHAFALIPACTCRGSISCCPPLAGFSDSLFDLIQHPSTIYFLEPLNLFSPQLCANRRSASVDSRGRRRAGAPVGASRSVSTADRDSQARPRSVLERPLVGGLADAAVAARPAAEESSGSHWQSDRHPRPCLGCGGGSPEPARRESGSHAHYRADDCRRLFRPGRGRPPRRPPDLRGTTGSAGLLRRTQAAASAAAENYTPHGHRVYPRSAPHR